MAAAVYDDGGATLWDVSPLAAVAGDEKTVLRCYQFDAVRGIFTALETNQSTLLVMATGTGKTEIFSHFLHEWLEKHPGTRAVVLAHREELVSQAHHKIGRVRGERPTIEKAERFANSRSRVVVASVQTLNSRRKGVKRMARIAADKVSIVVIDEGHHAVAETYKAVIEHFCAGNPQCKFLFVTATPDRHDNLALGAVCASVAYQFPMAAAVAGGWLVPLRQNSVTVTELDLSKVRTTAGDLNSGDLAHVLEFEKVLHKMAAPTLEIACGLKRHTLRDLLGRHGNDPTGPQWRAELAAALAGPECRRRQTLVFCASVAHAARFAELLNRWVPACAAVVDGKTPDDERKTIFKQFAARKIQYLVNVGVVTEGTDLPGVEVVVMGRPTKSRALFEQMIGRGTRPADAIARALGGMDTAAARKAAIATSAKPYLEVVDFVGNCGTHKLVTIADVLGGDFSDGAKAKAKAKAAAHSAKTGLPADVAELLLFAEDEIAAGNEKAAAAQKAAAAERINLVAAAEYRTSEIDPFDLWDIKAPRRSGEWRGKARPTPGQVAQLERLGVNAAGLTRGQAGQILGGAAGKITRAQAALLAGKGRLSIAEMRGLTVAAAARLIDKLQNNGWRRPGDGEEKALISRNKGGGVEEFTI